MDDIEISDWTKLGSTIRAERKRAGLSQQALADLAGTSRSWLARLESGHRKAELETIMRLLRALDLGLVLRRPTGASAPRTRGDTPSSAPSDEAMAALRDRLTSGTRDRRQSWGTDG